MATPISRSACWRSCGGGACTPSPTTPPSASRTLVVSDLHLGSRWGRDVLRHPQALEPLLAALDDVGRLVLLGDVVELAEGRTARALAIAEPVLRAIGRRLGPEREAILVPGNHDAALVRPWIRVHGPPPAVDTRMPDDATPALERVVGALAPARVRVHYPGVWLGDRVWGTHGHYLDRHLLPEAAFGVTRGLLHRHPPDPAGPADYERARRPSMTGLEGALARLPRPLARVAEHVEEIVRAATMPLPSPRLAPLTSRLLGAQMQRASIPALARVVDRLGVDADWVVFGHVHRAGPLPGDDTARWEGPGGRPRLVNTGSWVHEPLVVHRASPPHPYWPGSAVLLDAAGEPTSVALLEHLDAAALRGGTD